MAPERSSRPGGFGLPGLRDSAPTTASRTAGDDAPSRAEVQQRVHSLYDRAETDSGTFNATRAMAVGNRRRHDPPLDRERRRVDPTLDAIARQWFDAARASLGPTVPAALPADRLPERVVESWPELPAQRAGDDLDSRERVTNGRLLPELTAGPAGRAPARPLELTAGPAERAPDRPLELAAGPVAALPAAPEPHQETPALKALPAPATKPSPSPLRNSKEQSRRKLAAARELLAQHTAQHSTRLPALQPVTADTVRPVAGGQAEWQQPSVLGTGMPGAPLGVSPALAAATPVVAAMPLVTDALAATTAFVAPDVFRGIDTLTGTVPADAFTGTLGADAFATPDTPDSFAAGAFAATDTFATATGADVSVGFGAVPVTGYETKAAKALTFARAQIGRPCVRGAAGPDSYDAPGLTQAAWKAAGVVLPRTAQDQAALGTAIPLTDIRPGDLIFFYDTNGHVGVYAGDAMMIHAPGPGACIREESIFFAGNAAIHAAARPA